jgi:hypothetical protein
MTALHLWLVRLAFPLLACGVLLLSGCGKPHLDSISVEPATATLTVGETLQLQAIGRDAKGKPMEGLAFTWAVAGENGRIDATGLFTALKPGPVAVTVALGDVKGATMIVVERETVAKFAAAVVPLEVTVGQQATLTVTAQNAEGKGIADVQVQARPTTADTVIAPLSATTDATGQAMFMITAARQPAANQVQLNADSAQATIVLLGLPGPPASMQVTATATTVVAGEDVRLQIIVQDAAGNPVPGQRVSFSPVSENIVLVPAQEPTNVQGHASATVRTSTSAGLNRVRIAVTPLPPQEVEIQGTPGEPSHLILTAENADTVAGGTVTVTAQVRDIHGNSVANVPLRLTVSPAGAALEATALSTDTRGTAQVHVHTSPEAGDNVVRAVVAGLPAAYMTVTGQPPTALRLVPQTASVAMLGTQHFQAIATDASGRTADVMPVWKITNDTGTINAKGVFTAAKFGSDVVVATYAGLTAGAQLTVVPGEVAVLRVTPAEAMLVSGTTQQFQVEAFNAYRYPLEITPTWKVTNDVGTIDASGLLTATKAGGGEIVVTADGTTSRTRITVTTGELTALVSRPEHVVLRAGETIQLHASGRDTAGNPVLIEPTWRLITNLGEIEPSGLFRARYAGTGHIRVEAGPRPVVADISVEVLPAALHRLEVRPQTLTLSAGEAFHFTATGYDMFGNAIEVTPVWELAADLGTIDTAGTLTAQRVGAALVQATVEQLSAQASVIVKPGQLASLTLEPSGPLTLAAGDSVTLAVGGYDAYGNTIAVSPAWSQTEPLLTLSNTGYLRAEKVGTTTVVAQSDSQSVAAQVTVTPGKLAKLMVSPADATLQAGEVLSLQTIGRDAYDNEVEVRPTWRVVNDIGEVSPSGQFTALRAQTGQVIAMAGGVSGSAQITVDPGPLAFLKVTPEDLRLTAGETGEIIAVGYDAFGNPVLTQPVWQITEGMGTMAPDGLLTAQKAGEGRVVVTLGHLAAVLPLQVERGEVAMLRIDPAQTRVASGLQQQFTLQGFDRGGNQVPVTGTWEVRGNIGTIDTNGLLTASLAETGMVVARADPLMATAEVHVEPGPATSLRVAPETVTLTAGEHLILHSEAFDAAGNRVPIVPAWTVTEELGTVSSDGVFHARRAGSGSIIATLGEVQQVLQVFVQPAALAAIALSPAQLAISAGDKAAFTAAGFDAYGNTVPIEPLWSLQGSIGQIDAATGTFQATTAGAGTVVAVVGTIAGLAPVSVSPGTAVRVQIDPPATTLTAGEAVSFTATVLDAYNNSTIAEIAWSLTEPLGELADGTLQAQHTGTTDLIASTGAIQARAMVQVQPGPVVRLQVTPQQAELPSGQMQQFRALGYDAYDNVRDIPVHWELTGAVGQLDAAGVLTAGRQGIGQITARLDGLTAHAEVVVVPGPVQHLLLTPGQTEIAATTAQAFTATGLDASGNASPVTVNWAMTEGLGSLDQEGRFTAAYVGKGTVVAYTNSLVGTAEVRVTPGPVALLFVSPQLSTVRAGQTVQFQAQGFDAYRNPIPALTPSWSTAGNIGLLDPQTGMFTATLIGLGKVQATIGGESGSADVIVQPSMPDAEQSRLVASRVTMLADGKTAADIIVLVRDRFGNPVTNAQVTLISSREDGLEQPGPSNQQGIAVGRVRSTKAGLSDITAVVESVRIGNSLRLTFNQPGAAG